tara:strand:+ start:6896 stop:7645 length:750 start_codon:yes stop_codon:yes gene_type:complete
MTDVTLDRKKALAFLSSFGENVEDLLVMFAGARATGTVGFDTHYLRRHMLVPHDDIRSEGNLGISDLKKVVQFCKKAKGATVRFSQQDMGKQLTVKCDSMTLKVPTMSSINSYSKVPFVEKILRETEKSMFTTYKDKELEGHGTIDISNLKSVSSFKNFFAYPNFMISIHPEEREFFLRAGKQGTMQLTIDIELTDTEGPNKRLQSKFGKWLMDCTSLLEDGNALLHMGENTFLFIQQDNTFLVIKNEA